MSIYLCVTFFNNIVQVCEKKRQTKATHIFKVETPQTTEGKSESERNFNGRNTNKLEYRHYLYKERIFTFSSAKSRTFSPHFSEIN